MVPHSIPYTQDAFNWTALPNDLEQCKAHNHNAPMTAAHKTKMTGHCVPLCPTRASRDCRTGTVLTLGGGNASNPQPPLLQPGAQFNVLKTMDVGRVKPFGRTNHQTSPTQSLDLPWFLRESYPSP